MEFSKVKDTMTWNEFETAASRKHASLIETFDSDIAKLSKKTRDAHNCNLDCFLNYHLVRRENVDFDSSLDYIMSFFTYTLQYKVLGITVSDVKSYAATLRKFYRSMAEHGLFPKKALREAFNLISQESSDLIEELEGDDGSNSYW